MILEYYLKGVSIRSYIRKTNRTSAYLDLKIRFESDQSSMSHQPTPIPEDKSIKDTHGEMNVI